MTKHRLILDFKRSGISARTRKTHRVVLPRVSDAVHDALSLAAAAEPEHDGELFVLDFTDAFWHVPLHPSERRHFIGHGAGAYWVFRGDGTQISTTASYEVNAPDVNLNAYFGTQLLLGDWLLLCHLEKIVVQEGFIFKEHIWTSFEAFF